MQLLMFDLRCVAKIKKVGYSIFIQKEGEKNR